MSEVKQFEVDDFSAGTYILRVRDESISRTGYLSTVMQKVGYIHVNDERYYCLTDMSDGWTRLGYYVDGHKSEYVKFTDKQVLVDYLNHKGTYRRATHEEVLRVVFYNGNRK